MDQNDPADLLLDQVRAPVYLARTWHAIENWLAAKDIPNVIDEMVRSEVRNSWEQMLHRRWFRGYLN
jgi:hypothetical protein